jgi:hypothetical protein
MALNEACQLWIEQRIDEELESGGKSHRAIGRELAAEIEKMFETKINPESVRSRVRGAIKKSGLINPPTETSTVGKNTEDNKRGPHRWAKGESGNPVGRPIGSINLSQKRAWGATLNQLGKVVDYMIENCEILDSSEEATKERLSIFIRALEDYCPH